MPAPEPYRPRRVTPRGVRAFDDWRMKVYTITCDGAPADWDRFEEGIAAARAVGAWPPSPAVAPGRHGVGFLIAHQGRTADYLVVCWWDNENELPMRVLVREEGTGGTAAGCERGRWRPARGGEGVCVWDLGVVWFERGVFVEAVLGGAGGQGAEEYLGRELEGKV